MLDLIRASAGSGKTYALARYYITCFIGYKDRDTGKYMLRPVVDKNGAEDLSALRQGLRNILAITFTNKATVEMQLRIVQRLDDLAHYAPGCPLPDYMDYLSSLFDAAPERIANISGKALRVLLENYSDFNVSTIDSFFQSVMRNLAYEVGVPQSYQVEIESNFISRMGLDAVIDDVDASNPDNITQEAMQWIKIIIDNDSNSSWNFYQRAEKASKTSYQAILKSFDHIDNEVFRSNSEIIETWLSDNDLYKLYCTREKSYIAGVHKAYNIASAAASRLEDVITKAGWNDDTGSSAPYRFAKRLRDFRALSSDSPPSEPVRDVSATRAMDANPMFPDVKLAFSDFQDAVDQWRAAARDIWSVLRENYPFLGLLKSVLRKRRQYLDDNSSVELGQTSVFIRKFISDPDVVPFLYEKMGEDLRHLLIDEFQDTSSLQWHNLRSLVEQSLDEGYDNLIIGDAKQSIYRFRNANPDLISRVVPKLMETRKQLRLSNAANKNFRSRFHIVDFNNRFFSYLANEFPCLSNVYSDVQQGIVSNENGFVSISLVKRSSSRGKSASDVAAPDPEGELTIPERVVNLILDALTRGFALKDIAVLSLYNAKNEAIIEAIRNHNASGHPVKIDFVSEQSLVIGSSEAVGRVETVLRAVAHGTVPRLNPKEDWLLKGVGNAHDLECHLLLFRQAHPDLDSAECLELFLKEYSELRPEHEACEHRPSSIIGAMLADMKTTSLPALVESVIYMFVPDSLKQKDAPFLSAFQDCVLEFCDGRSSDLPSFLEWWERVRNSKSISSPEEMNAVRIMTVHKSKGLEFPVVISPQPMNTSALGNNSSEKNWIWVPKNTIGVSDSATLDCIPPLFPLRVTKKMVDTPLEPVFRTQCDLETMDNINSAYVAFTRAAQELYIIMSDDKKQSDKSKKSSSSDSKTFGELLRDFGRILQQSEVEDLKIIDSDSSYSLEYGVRSLPRVAQNVVPEPDSILDGYDPMPIRYRLECRSDSLPFYNEDDAVENPRSRGNICHAVMEKVILAGDVRREIERARILGLTGPDMDEDLNRVAGRVMDNTNPLVRKWFSPGAAKIYTERSLLDGAHDAIRRPDRIMVWPDGSVDVIDYKFGADDKKSGRRYHEQVRDYMSLLIRTGRYTKVRGYLWYVFYTADTDFVDPVSP